MKTMIWSMVLFFSTGHVLANFSLAGLIYLIFIYSIWLLDVVSAYLRRKENKRYSRFENQFGGNFSDSSGGIYYGDGCRGINGKFGGGLR